MASPAGKITLKHDNCVLTVHSPSSRKTDLEMNRRLVRPERPHVHEGLVTLIALKVHSLLMLRPHVVGQVGADVGREVAVFALVCFHPLVHDLYVNPERALFCTSVIAKFTCEVLDLVVHGVDMFL